MSKFINLFGMTTAERLKYLESVVDEIYVLLNEERIWVYKGDFVREETEYSVTNLAYYGEESTILESSQIVYFTNGYIAIVNLVNFDDSVFTVNSSFNLKGDKGDTGANGIDGERGETGSPALTYNNIYYASFPVEVGAQIVQETSKFNRVANIGDICNIIVASVATPRIIYMAVCAVTNVSSEYVTLTIRAVEQISSDSAPAIYKHNITISIQTVATNLFVVVFNHTSNKMTQSDLLAYFNEMGFKSNSKSAYQCTGTYCLQGSTNYFYPVTSICSHASRNGFGITYIDEDGEHTVLVPLVNEVIDTVETL